LGFRLSLVLALASPAGAQVRYQPTDLGRVADSSRGSFVSTAAGPRDLGTLGGVNGSAQGANDSVPIIGAADTIDGSSHAFMYTKAAGMQDLGTLGGSNSQANAIDSHEDTDEPNHVAGWSFVSDDLAQHAVVWDEDRKILDLGTLGGTNSQANAINCDGQVVGSSETPGEATTDAFVWDPEDGMQDLGTLGGSVAQATAINCAGQIVGSSSLPDDLQTDAFLYTNGSMKDLGNLGGSYSQATAINDLGRVVGFSNTAGDADTHAFLWTRRRGMQDLNNLIPANSGWDLQAASSIDNRRRIFGVGTIKGQSHAFVLVPVSR
jgi:probable HAF family extracellular repeat protein